MLAAVAVAALAVRWIAVEPFAVPSSSMRPTLRAGDHVLADKLAYVFVLGDSRGESEDSREFGAVPHDALVARVDARIWLLSRAGAVR